MTIFEEKDSLRGISKEELLGVSRNVVLRLASKGEVGISRIFCKVSLRFVQGIARTLISGTGKLCFLQCLRAIFRVHGLDKKHSL
jgi:hypothetical protein